MYKLFELKKTENYVVMLHISDQLKGTYISRKNNGNYN